MSYSEEEEEEEEEVEEEEEDGGLSRLLSSSPSELLELELEELLSSLSDTTSSSCNVSNAVPFLLYDGTFLAVLRHSIHPPGSSERKGPEAIRRRTGRAQGHQLHARRRADGASLACQCVARIGEHRNRHRRATARASGVAKR